MEEKREIHERFLRDGVRPTDKRGQEDPIWNYKCKVCGKDRGAHSHGECQYDHYDKMFDNDEWYDAAEIYCLVKRLGGSKG